jgi:hypothetical protein
MRLQYRYGKAAAKNGNRKMVTAMLQRVKHITESDT